jgi:hypothetical protein
MRTSGVWTYGLVNLAHILGVATLFGSVLVLDLRLLGAWRDVPLAAITRPTMPIAAAGFLVALVSGICLIATNATEYVDNPFLAVKFPAIAIGLVNVAVMRRLLSRRARGVAPGGERQLAVGGGVSLAAWLTAVACGRMAGYW